MSAAIKGALGVEPELIKGSGGVYEITVDGNLVFSKKALDRFPESDEEVIELLRVATA